MKKEPTLFSILTKITDFEDHPNAEEKTIGFMRDMFDRLIDTKTDDLPDYIHHYSITEALENSDKKTFSFSKMMMEKTLADGFPPEFLLSLIPVVMAYAYSTRNGGNTLMPISDGIDYFNQMSDDLYPDISTHHMVAYIGRCTFLKESLDDIIKGVIDAYDGSAEVVRETEAYRISMLRMGSLECLRFDAPHVYFPVEAEKMETALETPGIKSFMMNSPILICPERKYCFTFDPINQFCRFAEINKLFEDIKTLSDKVDADLANLIKS